MVGVIGVVLVILRPVERLPPLVLLVPLLPPRLPRLPLDDRPPPRLPRASTSLSSSKTTKIMTERAVMFLIFVLRNRNTCQIVAF